MIFAAWVVFLLLAAWLFQGSLERQFNPNSNPESGTATDGRVEVLLERNRAGHYVSSGRINGMSVEFLLDTGATDVAMSLAVADRLGLPHGAPVTLSTANGVVRGYQTVINEIALGDITRNKVRAVVSPGIRDDTVLLGMSFLKHIEMLQSGNTLLLRQ
ncbi:MAG: aspartyl protease [marine bacterium B5-7]|nr:MAG: aspartyl protease [marine bacterium B5-7]